MRIGFGYDVHRLVKNRKLILGGVEVGFKYGLLGHSDADVLIHALCDAIFGAMGKGDIGRHFPDTDPRYKDISSLKLLQITHQYLEDNGYYIINIDSTIVAQRPRLEGYIPAMKKAIADILACRDTEINVKATTTEALGLEGRGEGISAYAVVLIGGEGE